MIPKMECHQCFLHLVIFTFYSDLQGVKCASMNLTSVSNNTSATGFVINTVPPLPTSPPGLLPDIVLTLIVIAGCVLAGVGIAKIADVIYDRIINAREKEQAASEYARQMLRARAAVMNMRPSAKDPQIATTRLIAAKWMKRTAEGKYPAMGLTPNSDTLQTPIVKVTEATVKANEDETTNDRATIQPLQNNTLLSSSTTGNTTFQISALTKGNSVAPHPIEMIDLDVKKGGPLPPMPNSPKI